jgi:hypothetical protein
VAAGRITLFRAEEAEHLKVVASERVEEVVCWLTWDGSRLLLNLNWGCLM